MPRMLPARLPAALFLSLIALGLRAQVDTAAVVATIRQRMAEVDQDQLGALFIRMPDEDEARRIASDSPAPEDSREWYELYSDEYGTIQGIGTFITPTVEGITESSRHYFDADGKTIAIWWQLKWTGSKCTDGVAREIRYAYYHPVDSVFMQFTTLTNERGVTLDPAKCSYPEVERHFDVYLDRGSFMRAKRIQLEP